MKKGFVASVLVIMVAVSGALVAKAGAVGPGAPGEPPAAAGEGRGHGGMLKMMSEVLELSDAQQSQIKEIFAAGHEAMRPYHEQVRETRKQIRELALAGTFNEARVRELAEQSSQARIELMVGKARIHSQVNAVLTPDQQKLAKKLRPLFEGRRGHHGPRGGKMCDK